MHSLRSFLAHKPRNKKCFFLRWERWFFFFFLFNEESLSITRVYVDQREHHRAALLSLLCIRKLKILYEHTHVERERERERERTFQPFDIVLRGIFLADITRMKRDAFVACPIEFKARNPLPRVESLLRGTYTAIRANMLLLMPFSFSVLIWVN